MVPRQPEELRRVYLLVVAESHAQRGVLRIGRAEQPCRGLELTIYSLCQGQPFEAASEASPLG